ncbi:MAG: group II intron reverse transcriptase domain-containing protein [Lachnospiraceae bacterium]|nr:group II intron reverse transcriptase domain-containing protein [Lachnospiraceae bacterium]
MEVNKTGSSKKRIVYSYPDDFSRILKFICYALYRYDSFFSDNCFAFRPDLSAGDALPLINKTVRESHVYSLKADISDYFNSIDTGKLISRLDFLKKDDQRLYSLFNKMLTADKAKNPDGSIIELKRGAMAGIPVAPFFANVYLTDTDRFFEGKNLLYMRYSDDILICADSREELESAKEQLFKRLKDDGLTLNQNKLNTYEPGEPIEYLGFAISENCIDLAKMTKTKLKDKIRRKAHALRRWCISKKLPPERGAKGFITAMNHKLYVRSEDDAFSWSRWFFPNITTDKSLKELDEYMQQYVRWCVSGRHYKGNYRISYEDMKNWGYKSLVHEYHSGRKTYGRH